MRYGRIEEHPILKFERGRKVRFTLDGRELWGYEGEPIAIALLANGHDVFFRMEDGRPRGPFCMIGKCSSCLMVVDGVPNTRTCVTPLREGMDVRTQHGEPGLPERVSDSFVPPMEIRRSLVVVGGGPAGLTAAIQAHDLGVEDVLIVDEGMRLGGQLLKQTHRFFGNKKYFAGKRGIEIARILEREVEERGIEKMLMGTVIGVFRESEPRARYTLGAVVKREVNGVYKTGFVRILADAVIFATGAAEKYLPFENNDLVGVMGAGGIQTAMNVWGLRPGSRALVVGAGNVGVIVAYQMLQAGIKVEAIVEIMPRIGAYFVHAAKVARRGVPILTRHTILRAIGEDRVEGATIARVDDRWNPIPGTERDLDVDLIALSVGLKPSVELVQQAGARLRYVGRLGGFIAVRDRYHRFAPFGYVAGDLSGIEEATTAMMEGKIAGAAAAHDLGRAPPREASRVIREVEEDLKTFRSGPIGRRIEEALRAVVVEPPPEEWGGEIGD